MLTFLNGDIWFRTEVYHIIILKISKIKLSNIHIYNPRQVFTSEGKFINKYGGKGNTDGKFNSPCGIAADGDGQIYVSDFRNHRIHVL